MVDSAYEFHLPTWNEIKMNAASPPPVLRYYFRLVEYPLQGPRPWRIESADGRPHHGGRDWHVLWFRTSNEALSYVRRVHGGTVTVLP